MRAPLAGRVAVLALLATLVYEAILRGAVASGLRSRLLETNDISLAHGHTSDSATAPPSDREPFKSRAGLSPVILLPGDGGSRLQARLNRTDVTHHYCERKSSDWFDLWVNLSLLVPFAIDCWVDNMKLEYNSTSRRTRNSPGVVTRVHGFGSAESVEYVDPSRVYGTSYFEALVRQLVAYGYQRNRNIFGAPYDFRRAPNELADYFDELKKLVELAYRENDNERVTLICHSMGCLYGLYFLNANSQHWKDRHVRSIISLAGVYGGSVKAMKAFASGDNFGVVVVPSLSLRKDVRTFPSLAYLLPSAELWPADQVLVKNREKVYTVNDYQRFFDDIGHPTGYQMWLDVRNLTSPNRAPGVEVHCLHGHKVATPEHLDYEVGDFPDAKPRVTYGDGDGTVNLLSLQACVGWAHKQSQPLYYKNFSAVDHMTILSDGQVMEYIGEALSKRD